MGGGIRLGRLARFALREDILTWLALSGDPDLGGGPEASLGARS